MNIVRAFLSDESAATAIEYAMIVLVIALIVVTTISGIGEQVFSFFDSAGEGFE